MPRRTISSPSALAVSANAWLVPGAGAAVDGETPHSGCPIKRAQVGFGPRADMGDHFRRRDRAHAQAVLERAALRLADQEAGGEQVAGAGRVDHPLPIRAIGTWPAGRSRPRARHRRRR
jgi:hypothetical protein